MDHNIDINIETLKYFREKQSWSQEQLADKVGVKKDTYNKWERGRSKIRAKNQKKVAKELGVSLEKLKKAPPSDKAGKKPTEISAETMLSLDLVARTYHISPRDIIDFAPYLFHVVAGASLGSRKTKCNDSIAELTAALERTQTYLPHNPHPFHMDIHSILDDQLHDETEAIENHQLFDVIEPSTSSQAEDTSRYNPFANFIRELSDQAPSELHNKFDVSWVNDGLPAASIDDSYFADLTGLPTDHEMFQQIKNLLISGKMSPQQIRHYKVFSDNAFVHKHLDEYTAALKEKVSEIESRKEGEL